MKHHLKRFWLADSFPLTKIQDYNQSEKAKFCNKLQENQVVMKFVKEDIKKAAECLQLCTGQETGFEAAIHGMHKI